MGADINEHLIKKRRDQSRLSPLVCPRCGSKFRHHPDLRAHLNQHHRQLEDCGSPSSAVVKASAVVSTSSSPPPLVPTSAGPSSNPPPHHTNISGRPQPARDAQDAVSTPSPLTTESSASRSRTPQLPGLPDAAAAQMRISRLSLDEGQPKLQHPNLATFASDSPSRKRPASAEAHDSRSQAPRAHHRPSPQAARMESHQPYQSQAQASSQAQATARKQAFPSNIASGQLDNAQVRDTRADSHSQATQKRPPLKHDQTPESFSSELNMRNITFESRAEIPSLLHLQQSNPEMKREATSHAITREQLMTEVKGLYASLEIVEKRCIALDQAQMSEKGRQHRPEPKHWQALTALHRTLLYEHHDFLLASQHPIAPPELRAQPSERQMPFRMWKYAIHAYLELLRQHLPDSLEFMESFIYLSYQMMALLFETVPIFEDVWTECLGDLARYRMAIEGHSASVREVWSEVARWWYSHASDRQPLVGRLYHHLGILARPNLPRQLFYYCKALCCVQPFPNAKHSLKGIFEASINPLPAKPNEAASKVDNLFVRTHKLMYEATSLGEAKMVSAEFATCLAESFDSSDKKWREHCAFLAISSLIACLGYGAGDNPLRRCLERSLSAQSPKVSLDLTEWQILNHTLVSSTVKILVSGTDSSRGSDQGNALPYINIVMMFLQIICPLRETCANARSLLQSMPWTLIADRLTAMALSPTNVPERVSDPSRLQKFMPQRPDDMALMEDYYLRGLVWCEDYFPAKWFSTKDKDELSHQEGFKAHHSRCRRIIWSASMISMNSDYLDYDSESRRFEAGDITMDD